MSYSEHMWEVHGIHVPEPECEICKKEAALEACQDEQCAELRDELRDEGRSFGMGESYAERNV